MFLIETETDVDRKRGKNKKRITQVLYQERDDARNREYEDERAFELVKKNGKPRGAVRLLDDVRAV